MDKEATKQELVIHTIGYVIDQECRSFALNQMLDSDFILLTDANGKQTEEVCVRRGDDKQFQTVKRSSREKYNDFYDKKLNDIVEKFIKTNA